MTFVVVLLVAAALTAATMWFSRRGARIHQEDLNTHGEIVEPYGRRPADAAAEQMGVEDPGSPSSHGLP